MKHEATEKQMDRLCGYPAERGRWLLLPAGILVLLCLGSVYAWSVFRHAWEAELGIGAAGSLLPYTLALVVYAACMPLAGFLLRPWGARRLLLWGSTLIAVGYVLASQAANLSGLVLFYGVLAGAGVGVAYGVPLAVVAAWFPERRGMAVGITIIGFGLSPLLTAPLAAGLLTWFGVRWATLIYGLLLGVILLLLSGLFRLPEQARAIVRMEGEQVDLAPTPWWSVLREKSFHGLWLCFALGTFIGLTVIGISVPAGMELAGLGVGQAAAAVSFFALCNGGSRPFFGWLTDRWDIRYVLMTVFSLVLVAVGLLLFSAGRPALFVAGFALLWLTLGAWLAIAPAATARLFGAADYARNYGLLFTAYGVGALSGTLLVGRLRDLWGSYMPAVALFAFVALLGLVLAWRFFPLENSPASAPSQKAS
jgi:OFA family oxalate/formate antiporter-like MFS transporter